jgi:hypothetical protein
MVFLRLLECGIRGMRHGGSAQALFCGAGFSPTGRWEASTLMHGLRRARCRKLATEQGGEDLSVGLL